MKQKKIKLEATTLFVFRPKNALIDTKQITVTDPTTDTVSTITSTAVFQK